MEEAFYLVYHLHMRYPDALGLQVRERKWFLQRLIKQKENENEQMQNARRSARK